MAIVRTHHNAYDAHYHIVFPVKYRKALLEGDIPLAIQAIAGEIALRYDIEFEKIGCDLNHITRTLQAISPAQARLVER
jgi:putative transposase